MTPRFATQLLLGLLLPLALHATEPETVVPSQRTTRELQHMDLPATRLDRWHDRLFLAVQSFIERTDSRFAGDDEEQLPVPITPFRIGLDSDFISEPGGTAISPRLDVDMQLQMPNLQRRLRIFITSDSVEEAPRVLGRDSSGIRAGVRLTPHPFLDFDIGVRADVPPYAFTSVRWLRSYELGSWQLQPFAKLYLETHKGLGLASGASFERWMGSWIFRSSSYANWRKDRDDTEWTQALTLAHAQEVMRVGRFSEIVGGHDLARGYGLQLLVSGSRNTGTQRYETSLFFKHRTEAHWLYWHVAPLLRWERQFGWHPDPGINIGVDALFWDVSRR